MAKNKSQLRTENSNNFPNNNSQFITPEKLRDFNNDMIDSLVVSSDSGSFITTSSFDTGTRNLTFTKAEGTTYTNNIPGGSAGSTDTGSLLLTASFDNGTRNMTFTKGDSSTFNVNIPDATVSTGSLLTTASVSDATITFTKGDSSTFDITVNNVVNSTSSSHSEFAEDANDLIVTVKNTSGSPISKGNVLHATGVTGENINVELADNTNSANMPGFAIANESIGTNATGQAIVSGKITGIDTSGLTAGANVYVNQSGGFTGTKPTGSALIQNIGVVGKVNASEGELVVLGSGRSNDLPNITEGYLWVGDGDGVPEAISTGSFVKESETGSFARTDITNTFTAKQIVSGSDGFVNQQLSPPSIFGEHQFINLTDAQASGDAMNRVVFVNGNLGTGFGVQYEDYIAIEYYDSTNYNYGSEISINGVDTHISTNPSGSGGAFVARFQTRDKRDGTSEAEIRGGAIKIGTEANDGTITISKSGGTIDLNGDTNIGGALTTNGDLIASGGVTFVGGNDFNCNKGAFFNSEVTLSGNNTISGNTTISGEVSSSNFISASAFIGDGSGLTGVGGSGIFEQTGSFYATTNDLQITGSLGVSKAIGGQNSTLSIAGDTASLDLTQGNSFTLTLQNNADTHLDVSTFGEEAQSVNILVKQPSSGVTGSISFSSDFKFGQGYEYVPTPQTSSEDIISFTRYGNFLYGTYINNFS